MVPQNLRVLLVPPNPRGSECNVSHPYAIACPPNIMFRRLSIRHVLAPPHWRRHAA